MDLPQYLPIILNDLAQMAGTLKNPMVGALAKKSPTELAQVLAQAAALESLAAELGDALKEQIRAWTPVRP